jgi:hypothetical protein
MFELAKRCAKMRPRASSKLTYTCGFEAILMHTLQDHKFHFQKCDVHQNYSKPDFRFQLMQSSTQSVRVARQRAGGGSNEAIPLHGPSS